jgi:hypothetical protein
MRHAGHDIPWLAFSADDATKLGNELGQGRKVENRVIARRNRSPF